MTDDATAEEVPPFELLDDEAPADAVPPVDITEGPPNDVVPPDQED
jgi:hypothetical protein